MAGKKNDKRNFIEIYKVLGMVYERQSAHQEFYKHPDKNFTLGLAVSPSGNTWVKKAQSQLNRMVRNNFSPDELKILLAPLLKKKKLTLKGANIKMSAFVKNVDLEDSILLNLLKITEPPKKTLTTKISSENHRKLKNYAELNEQTMGEVIDNLMIMNSDWFKDIPDNPKKILKDSPSFMK